jgi:hypothetical protein
MSMATQEKYQGWANYETWNVALWFANDRGLYDTIREHQERFTAKSAKEFVKELLPNGTPDFESRGKSRAYAKVDWKEIAYDFNEMRGESETKEVRSAPTNEDKRNERWVTLYDDEALQLMQGWTGGQSDPLYAISSSGGANYAWVFQDAIANLSADLAKVKKVGNKYQLGKGTFTKKEIDELHTIHDALVMTLDDPESYSSPETEEGRYVGETHRVADFSTLPEVIAHAKQEGATHVLLAGRHTALFFPTENGRYEEARVWREAGYWHAEAQGKRVVVDQLPPGAEPIDHAEQQPAVGTVEAKRTSRGRFAGKPVPAPNPGMNPFAPQAQVRLPSDKSLGDAGAVYEFNIKLYRVESNASELEWEEDSRMALEEFEYDLREKYPWIGRMYQTGRSGGWLAVEDPNGKMTKATLKSISKRVEAAKRQFVKDMEQAYPRGSAARESMVQDYIAVDPGGRVVGGPFKDYGKAKTSADKAGGYVQYTMNEAGMRATNHSTPQRDAPLDGDAIAWRDDPRRKGTVLYVDSVPGDGGADWGYSSNSQNAKVLSPYWQRRFRADMERVGASARFGSVDIYKPRTTEARSSTPLQAFRPSKHTTDDRKAAWMRAFQDAAHTLGAVGNLLWQDAEYLYTQGVDALSAARRLYGPRTEARSASLASSRRRPAQRPVSARRRAR